jgi:hemolysin activation/secretion protein
MKICIAISLLFASLVFGETKLILLGQQTPLLTEDRIPQENGLYLFGITLPGSKAALETKLLPFLVANDFDLDAIKEAIAQFYQEHQRPFVIVSVPPQELHGNALQICVSEGVVGEIKTTGNRYVSSSRLKQYLGLKPGDPIEPQRVAKNLAFINRNPFRRTDLVYTAGQMKGTTDLELITKDRNPVRAYAGIDNYGVTPTGHNRLFAGANWANAFGIDHILSFQYTTTSNVKRFQSVTVHYTAPLSWKHTLIAYGGYSWLKVPFLDVFETNGKSAQGSLRYEIPLFPSEGFLHEVSFGWDYKWTNNETQFGVSPAFVGLVNLFQCVGSYHLDWSNSWLNTTLELQAFWSPGNWLPHQSNADYSKLRSFAKSHYIYGRLGSTSTFKLPLNGSFVAAIRGQYASQNLLASEQIGLGGYDTVRGYPERIVNVDNALIVNTEIRSPSFSLFPKKKDAGDEMYFLGFFDYGLGGLHKRVGGEPKTQYLMGIGPGVRYYLNRFASARLDWGFRLHKIAPHESSNRFHFSAIASY